jgi:hypothetical protein
MTTEAEGPGAVDLRDVIGRLAHEFGDAVSPKVIDETVRLECDRFEAARVRTYVPLLVERRVRRLVQDRADDVRPDVPEVTAP